MWATNLAHNLRGERSVVARCGQTKVANEPTRFTSAWDRQGLRHAWISPYPRASPGLRVPGFAHECAVAFEERRDSERTANPTDRTATPPPERAGQDHYKRLRSLP